MDNEDMVMVCAACKTASCWYGEFMCEDSQSAGVELRSVAELKAINREHPENWSRKKLLQVYGSLPGWARSNG